MTKLKLLFCVVVGLFGSMHVGAAVGVVQDRVEKKAHLARLKADAVGFAEQPCGAWTWQFEQRPLSLDLGPVPGNMLELARVVGIPFARLRCAIPEELCSGVTAQCVGRKDGLSAKGIEEHAAARLVLLKLMMGETVEEEEQTSARIPVILDAEETGKPILAEVVEPQPVQHVAATALMFSVMSMRCLLPEYELAQQHEAAAAYFLKAGLDPDERFWWLLARFKCMLASDNIRKSGQWLERARLCAWRNATRAAPL